MKITVFVILLLVQTAFLLSKNPRVSEPAEKIPINMNAVNVSSERPAVMNRLSGASFVPVIDYIGQKRFTIISIIVVLVSIRLYFLFRGERYPTVSARRKRELVYDYWKNLWFWGLVFT